MADNTQVKNDASTLITTFVTEDVSVGHDGSLQMSAAKLHTGAHDVDGGPVVVGNPLFVALSDGTNQQGTNSNPIRIDPVGTTTQPVAISQASPGTTNGVQIVSALPAGTNMIGALAANQSVNLAQVGASGVQTGHGTATGSIRVELPTDGTGIVGLAAGSQVIGQLAANQSVNLTEVAGAAVDTGHGTAAAAIRVELPTDGTGVVGLNPSTNIIGNVRIDQTTPGTTNGVQIVAALPAGTNTIGALTANQSVNLAQVAGATISQGHGTAASAIRVELPTDGTGIVGLAGGNQTIGALTANQTVNLNQVNGAGISLGHGVAATAIRVELPTDGTGAVGLNAGSNLIGNANLQDPSATTGNISAADVASTSTTNSINQTVITGTPTANSTVSVAFTGHASVSLQISGTANTTCAIERSIDGGTTWSPGGLEEMGIGSAASSIAMSDNKAYFFRGAVGSITNLRVRCTTFTSGTVVVHFQPSFGPTSLPVNQGVPNSAANAWPVVLESGATTNQNSNLNQVAGSAVNTGHGPAAGSVRVELPTDGTGVVGLNSGANTIGSVSLVPKTSGGLSVYRNFQTSGAVIAANVKGSAGQLYGLEVTNINATPVYVRLYNETSSPGTGDTVFWSAIVPGNANGAGLVKTWDNGIAFGTGIGIRVTNPIADTDNTALAANTVMVNLEYE